MEKIEIWRDPYYLTVEVDDIKYVSMPFWAFEHSPKMIDAISEVISELLRKMVQEGVERG